MHMLLAVGVTILTATTPSQPTLQPALSSAPPMTITFVQAPFDDALTQLARLSGVTIEIDRTVTEEVRRQPVYESAISMRAVSVEEAIATLTRLKGLSYSIVDARMVRVFKQA